MSETLLCPLEAIADGGSRGFVVVVGGRRRAVMAIRRRERVFVYLNTCPHIGAPLDFLPGQFLNRERTLIHCANHGALFRIEDGECIAGPCVGARLQGVATQVRDGAVYLVPG